MRFYLLLPFIISLSAACFGAGRQVYFFCGSAVKVPMDEIIKNYQAEKKAKISVIYGGSGALLSQIELSGKGDLYLSGSPDFIAIGENRKLLIKNTAVRIAYLVPGIIVQKGNPKNIRKLEDLGQPGLRIAIGNPVSVCLGLYGIELLDKNNLLEKVMPNICVFAKSCEDTNTLVALKNVDAILGWDIFESWNPEAVEWVKIEPDRIPRLAYIACAIPKCVKNKSGAEEFLKYIISEKSKSIFKKWGYIFEESAAKIYAVKAQTGGEYILPEKYFELLKNK